MPLVSTSDMAFRLLASEARGVTSFVILILFISDHAFLSLDCGIYFDAFLCGNGCRYMKPGRSASWKVCCLLAECNWLIHVHCAVVVGTRVTARQLAKPTLYMVP